MSASDFIKTLMLACGLNALTVTASVAQHQMLQMYSCPTEVDAKVCSSECRPSYKALIRIVNYDPGVAVVIPHKNKIPQEVHEIGNCKVIDMNIFSCKREQEHLINSESGGYWINVQPVSRAAREKYCAEAKVFNWNCVKDEDTDTYPFAEQPRFDCFTRD